MSDVETFFASRDDKISGPYTLEEMVGWVRDGQAVPSMQVCPIGTNDWTTLGERSPDSISMLAERVMVVSRRESKLRLWISVGSALGMVVAIVWALIAVHNANIARQQVQEYEIVAQNAQERLEVKQKAVVDARMVADIAKNDAASQRHLAEEAAQAAEVAKAGAEKYEKRAKEMQTLALSYAGQLFNLYKEIKNTSDLGKRIALLVQVSNDGPLVFDRLSIESQIRNELTRAGFTVKAYSPEVIDSYLMSLTVGQVEMTKGINSAYSLSFECYGRDIRGNAKVMAQVYSDMSFGYAGRDSNYTIQVRNFVSNSVTKCIATIDGIIGDVERVNPDLVFVKLAEAGVSVNPPLIDREERLIGSASGIVIASRPLILTNYHVVKGAGSIRVYIPGDKKAKEGMALYSDEILDLAVIGIKEKCDFYTKSIGPEFVTPDSLKTGAEIYSLGYPLSDILGKEVKFSAGVVSAKSGLNDDAMRFQHSAPTQPGSSGGPIFLKTGRLCGLVVSSINPFSVIKETAFVPQNVNYAIKIDTIMSFLRRYNMVSEIEADKRGALQIEDAKQFAVRIETFK